MNDETRQRLGMLIESADYSALATELDGILEFETAIDEDVVIIGDHILWLDRDWNPDRPAYHWVRIGDEDDDGLLVEDVDDLIRLLEQHNYLLGQPADYYVRRFEEEDERKEIEAMERERRNATGHLRNYKTGEFRRPATLGERNASREAAKHDGGAGVIDVDGESCYVEE